MSNFVGIRFGVNTELKHCKYFKVIMRSCSDRILSCIREFRAVNIVCQKCTMPLRYLVFGTIRNSLKHPSGYTCCLKEETAVMWTRQEHYSRIYTFLLIRLSKLVIFFLYINRFVRISRFATNVHT